MKRTNESSETSLRIGSRVYARYPKNGQYYWGWVFQVRNHLKKPTYKVRFLSTYSRPAPGYFAFNSVAWISVSPILFTLFTTKVCFEDGDIEDVKQSDAYTEDQYKASFHQDAPPAPPLPQAVKSIVSWRSSQCRDGTTENDHQDQQEQPLSPTRPSKRANCARYSPVSQPSDHNEDTTTINVPYNLQQLYQKKCGICALCKAKDCGKCFACQGNSGMGRAKSRRQVCVRKVSA